MEFLILVLLLLVVGGGYLWLRKRRRDLTPIEDDWPGLPGTAARPTEILTRDALASRPRAADLGDWDDEPEEAPQPKPKPKPKAQPPSTPKPGRQPEATDPTPDDGPPAVLDRDFLKGRQRRDEPLDWPED
jgi:hypothetical protein